MQPFRTNQAIQVRGYEMNASGSVPPAALLRYAEHARWQALAAPGSRLEGHFRRGVVRAQKLECYETISYPAELDIGTWVSRVGLTSFDFSHRIERVGGGVVALSTCTVVCLDDAGAPTPVADAVRDLVLEDDLPAVEPLSSAAPAGAWSYELSVRPSDQDILQHANQARYVDFVEDARQLAAAAGVYPEARAVPGRLWVGYRRENQSGERLRMLTWQLRAEPLAIGFELRRVRDGETVFQARFEAGARRA
jgi:acyl-CoA thioesterase FadM